MGTTSLLLALSTEARGIASVAVLMAVVIVHVVLRDKKNKGGTGKVASAALAGSSIYLGVMAALVIAVLVLGTVVALYIGAFF